MVFENMSHVRKNQRLNLLFMRSISWNVRKCPDKSKNDLQTHGLVLNLHPLLKLQWMMN